MASRFADNVIKELNKFHDNPKSIQRQCELIRKGFSRIKAGEPFLNEIDNFVNALETSFICYKTYICIIICMIIIKIIISINTPL